MIAFKHDDGGGEGDTIARAAAIFRAVSFDETKGLSDAIKADTEVRAKSYTGRVGQTLERMGFRRVKLARGVKPTLSQAYDQYGDCIVCSGNRVVCLKNGALRDTTDLREYIIIDDKGNKTRRERKALAVWIDGPASA